MTDKEYMLAKLSDESDIVVATAYVYAVNMCKFGKDVTEKWLTATTQSMALDDAYTRGRIESDTEWREQLKERKTGKWITEEIGIRSYATKCSVCRTILHRGHNFDNAQQYTEYVNGLAPYDKFCHECGAKMEVE